MTIKQPLLIIAFAFSFLLCWAFVPVAYAGELGSTCTSNEQCNFEGGVCLPDVDENGELTGSGTCTSEKLLTYEVVAPETINRRLLAADTQTGSEYTGSTQISGELFNRPSKPVLDARQSTGDTVLESITELVGNASLNMVNNNMFVIGSSGNASNDYQTSSGAIVELAQLTDSMIWNRPANSVEYIADIGRNAGLVDQALAQDGTGWQALNPVLNLWKAFRNMAYFAFVIVFIAIGLMIMFQNKIGGQAVVTIQMALPQIVVTLLLITFSYAIVALLIDLIYVLIYFVVGVFATFGILGGNGVDAINILLEDNIFTIVWENVLMPGGSGAGAGAAVNSIVTTIFTGLVSEGAAEALGGISGVLGYLIIAAWILFAVFKVFFQVLKAYIGIIFGIIFAPIILLFNAIPGRDVFWGWFKSILANALLFPALAVMILVGVALVGGNNNMSSNNFNLVQGDGLGYDPAQAQDVALPFIALNSTGIVGIIGLGFIIMLPHALELINKALGVDTSITGMIGQAVGGAVQEGWGRTTHPFRAAIGGVQQTVSNEVQDRRQARAFGHTPTTMTRGQIARQTGYNILSNFFKR